MLALATFILGLFLGFFICAALTLARLADDAMENWPDQEADGEGATDWIEAADTIPSARVINEGKD